MELPGFRFHPTEEELLDFYLKNMVTGKNPRFDIIDFLNIYHHDPWDLPGMAKVGEREWYFLVPRDRKHGNGGRPNRTTEKGFWKATGSDRKIVSMSDPKRLIGLRKTLVFYEGRAPRGSKTDWVMNEYRLPHTSHYPNKDNIVLCKIYRKATSLKVLEQRAAMEEPEQHEKNINPIIQMQIMGVSSSSSSPPHCSSSSNSSSNDAVSVITTTHHLKTEKVEELLMHQEDDETILVNNKEMGKIKMRKHENLGELEVPMKGMNMMMEYSNNYNTAQNMLQDPFWSQLINSPASWFQCLTPNPNYSNILNF